MRFWQSGRNAGTPRELAITPTQRAENYIKNTQKVQKNQPQ